MRWLLLIGSDSAGVTETDSRRALSSVYPWQDSGGDCETRERGDRSPRTNCRFRDVTAQLTHRSPLLYRPPLTASDYGIALSHGRSVQPGNTKHDNVEDSFDGHDTGAASLFCVKAGGDRGTAQLPQSARHARHRAAPQEASGVH